MSLLPSPSSFRATSALFLWQHLGCFSHSLVLRSMPPSPNPPGRACDLEDLGDFPLLSHSRPATFHGMSSSLLEVVKLESLHCPVRYRLSPFCCRENKTVVQTVAQSRPMSCPIPQDSSPRNWIKTQICSTPQMALLTGLSSLLKAWAPYLSFKGNHMYHLCARPWGHPGAPPPRETDNFC